MKIPGFLLLLGIALMFNACERHSMSELAALGEASEQAAVARICQLRAEGHSVRAIAAALTGEGHRPKRGGQWHPETVRRIISRVTWSGGKAHAPR